MLLHFKRPGESKVFGGALIKLGQPGHKPWHAVQHHACAIEGCNDSIEKKSAPACLYPCQ